MAKKTKNKDEVTLLIAELFLAACEHQLPNYSDDMEKKARPIAYKWAYTIKTLSDKEVSAFKEYVEKTVKSYVNDVKSLAYTIAAVNHLCWWYYSAWQHHNKTVDMNASKILADIYYEMNDFAYDNLSDEDANEYYSIMD